ncbi:AbfB domain-containing protein [Streptomyces sp. NPDC127098]|uniref:AbfB domain-containing protein n=1 Tax=Streptomyces sp. NPDC127098 TaxID=3347137 RepID=UPI00365650A8
MTPPTPLTRRNLLRAGAAMGAGTALLLTATPTALAAFTHPGALHTQADFDRTRAKVDADAQPWKAGWDRLVANTHSHPGWTPNPQETIIRGGSGAQNYHILYNDIHAAYQNALRWKITGTTAHADTARDICNAWSATLKRLDPTYSESRLASGIYGYQFANVGELMRGYPGFDLARFQTMMVNVFYPLNSDFLVRHNGTCSSHYWANWDLCNMVSIMAIGILCDDQAKFNEAVDYFHNGAGNGSLAHAIPFLHGSDLAQWQESGRDQAHSLMGIGLMGTLCEMAWNQGVDLYGADNSRFRKACEYVARYNLGYDVPYTTYNNCDNVNQTVISTGGRGQVRPVWERVYHHYAVRRGMAMPNTGDMVARVRPEGGGGDYGPNSGGFDELGFGTLTHARESGTATLPAGARSLQSVNYPTRYIRHQSYLGYLHEVTAASTTQVKQDATFTIIPGLAAPNGYSLRAGNGQYLRHYDFRVRLAADDGTAAFRSDATFIPRPGTASGSVRLESVNYPGRFLRHRDNELWLHSYDATQLFSDDSSFRVVSPWA